MKILVTGAGGTLGRPLVQWLRNEGHSVMGADLMHGQGDVRCDVRDMRQVDNTFLAAKPDYVIHLAAEFGRHNGDEFYEQCWSTNCVGTRNIIEQCLRFGSRLVFASSSEVYGELDTGEGLISEDMDQRPLRQTNDYAASKWANELQVMNAQETRGLEAVRLRFFNAYGPGERFHPYRSVVCLFCHAALNDQPFTVYRGYHRTFMHIDDFIPTLGGSVNEDNWPQIRGRAINIGGTDYRPVEDLAKIVLDHFEGACESEVRWMEEDEHNVVSKRPDISLAKLWLGHNPTVKLEEGVPDYIRWLETQETMQTT